MAKSSDTAKQTLQQIADAHAKQLGFPSQAAMLAFNQREQQRVTSRSAAGQGAGAENSAGKDGLLNTMMAIHPLWLFNYISDAISGATEQK